MQEIIESIAKLKEQDTDIVKQFKSNPATIAAIKNVLPVIQKQGPLDAMLGIPMYEDYSVPIGWVKLIYVSGKVEMEQVMK